MTFAELDDTLPNGLHDAYLCGLSLTFGPTGESMAVLDLLVLVSGENERARHERAQVILREPIALVIEAPEKVTPIHSPIGISSFDTSVEYFKAFMSYESSVRDLFHSLYVEDPWNTYIHLAAGSAEVLWPSTQREVQTD